MKKIAFLGEDPNFSSAFLTTEDAYARSGNNVGNHAFWNAVDSHICNEKLYINHWNFDAKYVGENYDLLVIPASNFIHPDRDLGGLAKKIEQTKLPVLLIGLGAQAVTEEDDVILKEGTKHFVEVLKKQAIHITCRGKFTEKVLKKLGLKNISALGCPSNLTNFNPKLGVDIQNKLNDYIKLDNPNIILNIDSHRRKFFHEYKGLISLLRKNHFKVVCQNPIELVKLARGDKDIGISSHIDFQKKLWSDSYFSNSFDEFVMNNFVTFFNAKYWMEYSKKFDLSIGTRLHGNMLSLQAGTPAIFLSHDSRTSELVEIMHLPNVTMNDLNQRTIPEVIEMLSFDGESYDKNRIAIAKKYVDILKNAGLLVSQELEGFIYEN